MSALGQTDMTERIGDVRFAPKSGHCGTTLECPLCTESGHLFTMMSVVVCGRELFSWGIAVKLPDRVLEPVERISEILFGLIMALTTQAQSAWRRRIISKSGPCFWLRSVAI